MGQFRGREGGKEGEMTLKRKKRKRERERVRHTHKRIQEKKIYKLLKDRQSIADAHTHTHTAKI